MNREFDGAGRLVGVEGSSRDAAALPTTYAYAPGQFRVASALFADSPTESKDSGRIYGYRSLDGRYHSASIQADGSTIANVLQRYDQQGRLASLDTWPVQGNAAPGGRRPWLSKLGGQDRSYGSRTGSQQLERSEAPDSTQWDYSYSNTAPLGSVSHGEQSGFPGVNFGYTYDASGNRVTATRVQGGDSSLVTSGNIDAANRPNSRNRAGERLFFSGTVPSNQTPPVVTIGEGSGANAHSGSGATVITDSVGSGVQEKRFGFAVEATAGQRGSYQKVSATFSGSSTESGYVWVPPTSETLTYDLAGNLTSDARWGYNWDAENRLTQQWSKVWLPFAMGGVTRYHDLVITYTYDYRGRLASMTKYRLAGSAILSMEWEVYAYDGWNPILRHVFGGNRVASLPDHIDRFAWGPDIADLASPDGGVRWAAGGVGGLIGFTTSGVSSSVDGTYFPTYDGNGNVMGMLQKNGAGKTEVAAVYDYSPFGRLIRSTGKIADINPIRFSTKIHNQDAGLVYYGYRHYDPEAGRWLSRDPLGEDGGLNLYGMVGNDPVNKWDYLGLFIGDRLRGGPPRNASQITKIPGLMRKKGWDVAADLMDEWFSLAANDDAESYAPIEDLVKMDWVLKAANGRAKKVYDKIIDKELFANRAATRVLSQKLGEAGITTGKFNFHEQNPTNLLGEVSLGGGSGKSMEELHEFQNQFKKVSSSSFGKIDALTAALGNFALYTLAEGCASSTHITINSVAVYVRDSYDFNGSQFPGLGQWNFDDGEFDGALEVMKPSSTLITNRHYRHWRDHLGNGRGGDYILFSDMKVVKLKKSITVRR